MYLLAMGALKLPYERERCRFTSADGYFYNNVLSCDADIVVNIDEDAFVSDNLELERLIAHVISEGYVNCGMPDGGVVEHRGRNPLVTNPFFNIFNVRELRSRFDVRRVLRDYTRHDPGMESKAPWHLIRGTYAFDFYEPYVPFFLWISDNFKTLHLDAETHSDGISTILKSHTGRSFLSHAWYSREYGRDPAHTKRTLSLYLEATGQSAIPPRGLQAALTRAFERIGQQTVFRAKFHWERKILRWDWKRPVLDSATKG